MATPLGVEAGISRRGKLSLWRGDLRAVVLLGVLAAVVFASWQYFSRKRQPGIVAIIERVDSRQIIRQPGAALVEADTPTNGRLPGNRSDIASVEAQSGVKVIRQGSGQANGAQVPGGMVIKVPDAGTRGSMSGADPRVSERSQLGILPLIGEGGLSPRDVYAVPFNATSKPKIALVITGVGIGTRGTSDAISKLPGEVTLAFAPYGRDLSSQVARARREGHEILLQVPMEPRDYPDSDPGPHTLKADADPRANIERLHWLMSRFTGYVGIMNFMGGKLMAADKSYTALLEEMNRRGLLFIDDGSSRTSSTARLAGRIGLPARIADRQHDATRGKSLEAQLAEIETLAAANGSAILTVPALPGNIEKIAAWQRDLGARGIVLAPLSAIVRK